MKGRLMDLQVPSREDVADPDQHDRLALSVIIPLFVEDVDTLLRCVQAIKR